ncbi:cupredoxin domain-containing protein [Pseudogulbenkiania subflava]|uniref:Cupredoxin-like domain-containing protein n=1 Tax=Pseudogulbenkiania subflava DSM 22618 TaxID=1123014 RepID=A0A1Y6BBL1_9NEIS|nr:cupredoxin domain-containing protein [Pseudogulbenkiania subflava]SMF02657.1 Cupredoxin-like domain-containing protein [Pseudogulbenkiania subflava DSM 22618]
MRAWLMVVALGLASANVLAEELPVYRLELKDGKLNPARLQVVAGKKFKIELINSGKTPVEFESTQLRKEKVLGPGVESFVVVQSLSPGEYKFFDEFHMATAQGVIVAK